jgi:low affinity Fe/Cu permease
VIWAITGPIFNYSDTWQLVINTGTTIITFLMVFLIQHSQNRDTAALHVKLSELIIAMQGARNEVAAADDLDDEDLEAMKKKLQHEAKKPDLRAIEGGSNNTGVSTSSSPTRD